MQPVIPALTRSRKSSFFSVVRASGRESEMCNGSGAPRSLVRRDVRRWPAPSCLSAPRTSETRASCSSSEGFPVPRVSALAP